MNKTSLLFLTFFIIFINGCTQKTQVLKDFKSNTQSPMAIQYTKKRDIVFQNTIKVMVFSTYLNKIDKKFEDKELNKFIIGIHMVGQNEHDILNNKIDIKLNNSEAINSKKLDEDSELIKMIPLKNQWANYYLFEFKNQENLTKLNLKINHPIFGQALLVYNK